MDGSIVWTVDNYYNGCIIGVADFENSHYIYERIFDYKIDDWSDRYFLTPISQENFKIILANWECWVECVKSKSTSDWKSDVDLEQIAANSPDYRKTIRRGDFKFKTLAYFEDGIVKWSSQKIKWR